MIRRAIYLLGALAVFGAAQAAAQSVAVTLALDKSEIAVGETTLLHAYAQIVPAQRAGSDRIFSWYVDLLNPGAAAASLDAAALTKPASDNDPATSRPGTASGGNISGIFDTFMGLSGAGRDQPVELFSIPVKGIAEGSAAFRLQAGTGVTGLTHDFIVAPSGGGNPLIGGDYLGAAVTLKVSSGSEVPNLSISLSLDGGNPQILLHFTPRPGPDYFIESSDTLGPAASWTPLPGGPHNSGQAADPASRPHRFYRLRAEL